MQRRNLVTAVLLSLATLGAGAAIAATQTDAPRPRLDANADGVVDRGEAAAMPQLAQKFDQLDADKDGRLSRQEMPHHDRRGHGGHDGLARLDADGDGRISQQEATAKGGRMSERFAAMDLDKDGYVVRSELRSYEAKQRPIREAEFRKRSDEKFAAADLNRDGKLSRVEVDEKMPQLSKSFSWNDDDKDGFLSREELRAPSRR